MRFLKPIFSFLLLVCLPALFLWKLTIAGRILVGLDPFNFFYPYHDAVAAALNAGQLPEWNPALFGGGPFLADSQAQLFYPLSWPFLSWLAPDALTWGIVLHLAIAALGTYLWARRGLGMGHVGAWVAGAVFTLGGYLGAQIEHVNQVQAASWLPWLLLGYEWGRGMPHRDHEVGQNQVNLPATQRMFGVVLGAFALAMSLLAGHSQTTFISLVMLGLWTLRSAIRDDERTRTDVLKVQRSGISATIVEAAWRNFLGVNFVPLFIIVLIGGLLAAIQLVPTQQLSTLSQRQGGLSYLETVSFSFDPRIIPRALLPTFGQDAHLLSEYVAWVGFIALMLAIIGLIGEYLPWGRLLARPTRASRDFGLLATFTGLFLAFGMYNPVYWLLWRIVPGFSLFRAPARWLLLWAFGVAILAGVGLERLYHAKRRQNETETDFDPSLTVRQKRRHAPIVVSAGESGKQAVVMMDEMRATAIVIKEEVVESARPLPVVQTNQATREKENQKQQDALLLPEAQERIFIEEPSDLDDESLLLPNNERLQPATEPLLLPEPIRTHQFEQEREPSSKQDSLLLPFNEGQNEHDTVVRHQSFFDQKDVSALNQTRAINSSQKISKTEHHAQPTTAALTPSSRFGRRATQFTLLVALLLLLLLSLFVAWPSFDVLPWWIGASGLALLVLVSRPIWPTWSPISYPTFVIALILIELWFSAWSQDYQLATAPEAYNGLRPAPAHLMTAQPKVGAARILSLSNLTWDPGDLNALQERHASLLGEKPIYDLVVVTKLKEVLAPNQPMRWGIQTADGYGGGLLPSARWVSFQKSLPLAKLVPDGRLREQLTDRPRPALLDVMGVEWVIVDKVNDWWSENIFHDLGASVSLKAGDTQSGWLIPSPDGTWAGTDISWIVFGEWPATPGTITLDGQTFSLSDAEERATRETWRGTERHMLLSLNEAIRFKEISLQAEAEWHLGGITLVDSRLPGFQPLPADASVRTTFSGDVTIYQRLDGLGRAWVVPEAVAVETIDAAATFVAEPTFDPRKSVIVEHDSSNPLPTGGAGDVTWLHDQPGDTRLVVTVPEGGWLVLADAPFPGWQAIVDGQPVEWQAANVINRTLYLPAGKHTVTWRYYTPGLLAGLIGTLFGVILLIGWVVYALRRS